MSVLIASRGRLEDLAKAVGSLFANRPPDTEAELVLVASGSSETLAAMHRLAPQTPDWLRVVVLQVDRPGKTRALNHGLPHCQGDVIVFTDDDVIVREDYLIQALNGFEQTGADALQGQVRVTLPDGRPGWFTDHCAALMAGTTYLDRSAPVELPNLNSCNMAVRREAVSRAGPFDERLGPGTPRFPLGDDTEWSMRLARLGLRLQYWPAMSVEHQIPGQRATLGYVATRAYLSGVFSAAAPGQRSVRRLLHSTLRLLIDGVRMVQAELCGNRPAAVDRLLQVARHGGVLAGVAGRARGHPLLDA
ncbi:MAG TPA: glycosyltransferase family 2 protein [Candidatus Xenobia bacterium]